MTVFIISLVLAFVTYGLAKGFLVEYMRHGGGRYTQLHEIGCWLFAVFIPGIIGVVLLLIVSFSYYRTVHFCLSCPDELRG